MEYQRKSIGICSYAFRYSIGTKSFKPVQPFTVFDFIDKANRLGYGRALIFDNLNSQDFDEKLCAQIGERLSCYDMSAVYGLKHLTEDTFEKYLPLAKIMNAESLRFSIPLAKGAGYRETLSRARKIIMDNIYRIEEAGITIGIENHFDLQTSCLVELVDLIGHPLVKHVCDTTNSIAFIEKPIDTLHKMKKNLYCMHIKDFVFEKPEAGYFMNGTILGKGSQSVKEILKYAFQYNPDVKIGLEMTIKRPDNIDDVQVTSWEIDCIEKSTKELFAILDSM
ncbi:MAG: sugar phosphate isomerase/epimerase family protein [Clostridia bacterium]